VTSYSVHLAPIFNDFKECETNITSQINISNNEPLKCSNGVSRSCDNGVSYTLFKNYFKETNDSIPG
jgi:hypothetical protein